jgi:predicted DNA binding CopG/RHH family protein
MEKQMNSKKLPQTDSIQELAEFWDTHDLTEFEVDLEEVSEPVFEREKSITLHLGSNEAETLHQIAESKGMPDSELVREWVLEKLSAT